MTGLRTWLQRLQADGRVVFSAHGRYCAKHQIPSLLTICLVSCLLFYPALDLYFWTSSSSPDRSLSGSWSRAGRTGGIRSRFGSRDRSFSDLEAPWDGLEGWSACEDEKCWDRCPREGREGQGDVRLLRVLVTSEEVEASREGHVHEAEHGMLERRALHRALKYQHQLGSELDRRLPELDRLGDPLSVFAYWNHSDAKLLADPAIEDTIDLCAATSSNALGSLLAGKAARKNGHLHRADYLVVNWAVQGPPPLSIEDYLITQKWRELASASLRTDGIASTSSSASPQRRILLRRSLPSPSPSSPSSTDSPFPDVDDTLLFSLAYFIVGMYVYLTLRKLDQVHSRTGLVFTGLVEVAVSGILSLSVCSLFGIEFDLVPWKLLPFVVAVLGVDNMLLLADAVVRTSIDLPVFERIAQGLGSIGFSLTISLLAEVSAIYCVILIVPSDGMVRELCIFSIVALVVEYFLELTFFLTVLSIDLQRLELADLLRQGATSSTVSSAAASLNGVGGGPRNRKGRKGRPPQTGFATTFGAIKKAVAEGIRARQARVATFNVLFMTFFLMWLTRPAERYLPSFCADLAPPSSSTPSSAPILGPLPSASEALWDQLNPLGSTMLPIILEPPLITTFSSAFPLPIPSLFASRLLRGSKWAAKVVIFPISTTTLALYFVLVFLLKDADKLEAQRNRGGATTGLNGEEEGKSGPKVGWELVTTLEGVHVSDADFLATDGVRVLSGSAQGPTLSLLRLHPNRAHLVPDEPLVSSSPDDPPSRRPTAIGISPRGDLAVVGHDNGGLTVWDLNRVAPTEIEGAFGSSIRQVAFFPTAQSPGGLDADAIAAVVDAAGGMARFAIGPSSSFDRSLENVVPRMVETRKARLVNVDDGLPSLIRSLQSGVVEIWRPAISGSEALGPWRLFASVEVPGSEGKPTSFLTASIGSRFESTREVLIVGTSTGSLLAHDVASGPRLSHLTRLDSSVRQVRVAWGPGGTPIVIASSATTARFLSVATSAANANAGAGGGATGSEKLVPSGSPKIARSLSASYRASPRLRRVSAVTAAARGAGTLAESADAGVGVVFMPSFGVSQLANESATTGAPSLVVPESPFVSENGRPPSPEQSLKGGAEEALVAEQVVEDVRIDVRGGWEVVGSKAVGIRKAKREGSLRPITGAAFEGWEVWEVDFGVGAPPAGRWNVATTSLMELATTTVLETVHEEGDAPRLGKRRSGNDNKTLSALFRDGAKTAPSTAALAYPPLPFSRVRPIVLGSGDRQSLAIGLGNVVGLLVPRHDLVESRPAMHKARSRSASTLPPPKGLAKKIA